MSSFTVGLAMLGGVILAGLVGWNAWTARKLTPRHSFNAIPQMVLKIMMLAMCRVQLENLYCRICVSPMV